MSGCRPCVGAYPVPVPDPDLAQRAAPVEPVTRTPWWGLGDAAVGWLMAQVMGMVAVGIVLGATGEEYDDLSLGWLNVAQVGMWIPMVAIPFWAAALKGNGAVRDFRIRGRLPDLPIGLAAGIVCQWVLIPLLYLPIYLLSNLDSDDLGEAARELTDRADDPFSVVMLVLLTGIGAPLVEELFYRGLVLRSMERRFGTAVGVVASGVIFGLVHFNAPLSIPGLMVFGVVLGVLAVKTDGLAAPVIAHIVFNMHTVILLLSEN